MRNLLAAVAALVVLAACDPTKKDDMSCTADFHGLSACTQFHITDTEAVAAKAKCEESGGINGNWTSNPCSSDGRISGFCQIEASQYTLSGTDAKVFFYGTDDAATREAARHACEDLGGGVWHAS